jgi:hypothetical protein
MPEVLIINPRNLINITKNSFFNIGLKTCRSQIFKDFFNIEIVLEKILRIDKNIIYIYRIEIVQVFYQHVVNIPLK